MGGHAPTPPLQKTVLVSSGYVVGFFFMILSTHVKANEGQLLHSHFPDVTPKEIRIVHYTEEHSKIPKFLILKFFLIF